jgi:asparagine synthase (glutamine-hydrolysing)
MLWIERIKRVAGPLTGALSKTLSLLLKVIPWHRLGKYLPLLDVPFESYYYSRASSPFYFFNAHYKEAYSNDFCDHIDKQRSLLPVTRLLSKNTSEDILSRMLYVDTKTWLPDDLLIKADKMTMANSLELRVPLLDHKLLEFAATLPSNFKVRGLTTKYIAKRALGKQIPDEIIERKKAGFPVPYENWLQTDLRASIHDVLLDRETLDRGYFKKSAIEKLLRDNVESGAHARDIFSLLVLELWHRQFLSNRGGKFMPTESTYDLSHMLTSN